MIKNFFTFMNENYETGYFSFDDKTFKLKVFYDGINTTVKVFFIDKYYEDLSIIIPESKNLDTDEFFVNPILNDMIKELETQGFVEHTKKESIAGNKKTKSYKLV